MHNDGLSQLVAVGHLGPVYCGGREILRRLFVTLRDRNWREIAPTQWESTLDERQRVVTLQARHVSEDVDFEWRGTLRANEDFTSLDFAIEGRAVRDMDVCRVGLVVLHPVDTMVGSQLTATGKLEERLVVTQQLHPQPIVAGLPGAITEPFSRLKIERADFGVLELSFAGELFELEDQRNWGDASFKTYCTPLRLGFPRPLQAGATIAHSVHVAYSPASAKHVPKEPRRASATLGQPELPSTARAAATLPRRFPDIGRVWRAPSAARPDRQLPWRHFHLDITDAEDVTALSSSLGSTDARVEVSAQQADEQPGLPATQLGFLQKHHARLCRVLVYGSGVSLPQLVAIEQCRDALQSSHVPVLAATRGYFVEFNRSAPWAKPLDGIAFPLTATVHSDDAETIAGNATTIRDMAETARRLGHPLTAIAPLALYFPAVADSQRFPPQLVAAWTAATIINAALAGVSSITLAEDVIAALATAEGASGQPLLAALLECSGAELLPCAIPLPCGVHALVMSDDARRGERFLVASLEEKPVAFAIDHANVREINASMPGIRVDAKAGQLILPPFGVAWIRFESPH